MICELKRGLKCFKMLNVRPLGLKDFQIIKRGSFYLWKFIVSPPHVSMRVDCASSASCRA